MYKKVLELRVRELRRKLFFMSVPCSWGMYYLLYKNIVVMTIGTVMIK